VEVDSGWAQLCIVATGLGSCGGCRRKSAGVTRLRGVAATGPRRQLPWGSDRGLGHREEMRPSVFNSRLDTESHALRGLHPQFQAGSGRVLPWRGVGRTGWRCV